MLEGTRVLDLTGEPGFLAGKILGDLGLDVIKVERPGGDPDRRGPWLGDVEDPERSLLWLALNTSKRGVTLNLDAEAGRALFQRLAGSADVVLESFAPGEMAERGLGYDRLREENPRLVQCAVTPFGQTGPRAGWKGGDLVVVAMGGNAAMTGYADRPPVRCTSPTAYIHGGPEAALGVLSALYAREATGEGAFVDVSLQECQLQSHLSFNAQHALRPEATPTRQGDRVGGMKEIWRTMDGWVSFGLRGGPARTPNLEATVAYMAENDMAPDWLRDYDWRTYNHNLLKREDLARLEDAFGAFFETRSMAELYEQAVKRRIFLAPCNHAGNLLDHVQLREREFFVRIDYPEFGASVEHPDFFARTLDGDIRVRRRAPAIGEHNAEIYGELGVDGAELERLSASGVV